jgi:hypothetical protein
MGCGFPLEAWKGKKILYCDSDTGGSPILDDDACGP